MAQSKHRHPPAGEPAPLDEVAAAYALHETEIAALPADDVGRVTTDVATAVSLALGAVPRIQMLMPEIEAVLKKPPVAEVARFRTRALALLHTHLRWVPRTSKSHEDDLEEARVLRELLLAAADTHVKFGHMDAGAVVKIREGSGFLDRANDVIALATLFRTAWPKIVNKTPVDEAQLARATELGTLLVAELGGKALGTGAAAGDKMWADRRARAFRLFIKDYEELRRAVEYVRYHAGDADQFTPSLHPRQRASAVVDEEKAPSDGTGGGGGSGSGSGPSTGSPPNPA